jgi:hypothetical protein
MAWDNDVLVYRYDYWSELAQSHIESRDFATLDTIKAGLGTPIHSSEKRVPRADVMGGFFVPPRKKPALEE